MICLVNGDKAYAFYGFTSQFFMKALIMKTLEPLVCPFQLGKLLGEVIATILSLIPKTPNPSKMGDFKQFTSCCNIIYKCITLILVNRLKPCLSSVVCAQLSYVNYSFFLALFYVGHLLTCVTQQQ